MIPWFDVRVLSLGPVQYNAFGLLVAIAIIVGSKLMRRRGQALGLDDDKVFWMMGMVFISGIVCSHLFDVFAYQTSEPLTLTTLLNPFHGMSSYGGFIGATAGLFLWCKWKHQPRMPYADCVGYGMAAAWFFGRLGCFAIHDHPGRTTNFFLGVQYPWGARHDLGLYEALWSLGVVVLFEILWITNPKRPAGVYLSLIAMLYGPVRFCLDFLRAEDTAGADPRYWGFTPAQYLSVLATLIGAQLARWTIRNARPVAGGPGEATGVV